jgi:hypothetical protein
MVDAARTTIDETHDDRGTMGDWHRWLQDLCRPVFQKSPRRVLRRTPQRYIVDLVETWRLNPKEGEEGRYDDTEEKAADPGGVAALLGGQCGQKRGQCNRTSVGADKNVVLTTI